MKKWEYKVGFFDWGNPLSEEERLNIFGQDGWELVGFKERETTMMWVCVFKRPLQEKFQTNKLPPLLHVGAEEFPEDIGNDGG